jgi:putative drug exporter of the RND superfamily
MIAVTAGAILVVIGIAFRSLVIPLRAVLTIAVTLAFCYGWTVFVYVDGALAWTHFWGFSQQYALLWMPPLVSFSILVGLSVDYDIFLLVRIREEWLAGFDTREAICCGVAKSGNIISSAGVIMAVAFSGLLFSGTSAMNQLSFYLVFAVLFDTFVVRPLLAPALFSLAADTNWWPGDRWMTRSSQDL